MAVRICRRRRTVEAVVVRCFIEFHFQYITKQCWVCTDDDATTCDDCHCCWGWRKIKEEKSEIFSRLFVANITLSLSSRFELWKETFHPSFRFHPQWEMDRRWRTKKKGKGEGKIDSFYSHLINICVLRQPPPNFPHVCCTTAAHIFFMTFIHTQSGNRTYETFEFSAVLCPRSKHQNQPLKYFNFKQYFSFEKVKKFSFFLLGTIFPNCQLNFSIYYNREKWQNPRKLFLSLHVQTLTYSSLHLEHHPKAVYSHRRTFKRMRKKIEEILQNIPNYKYLRSP